MVGGWSRSATRSAARERSAASVTRTVAPESASRYRRSSSLRRGLMGTLTIPARAMAKSHSTYSNRFRIKMATRAPGSVVSPPRTLASRPDRSPTSAKVSWRSPSATATRGP